MGTITSIIIICLASLSYKKEKHLYAPGTMFLGMWAIITFMASLHLFNMYEASDKVYLIILVGCVSYYMGVINTTHNLQAIANQQYKLGFIYSKTFFWIAFFYVFISRIEPFIKSLVLLQAGTEMGEMRTMFFEQSKSPIEVIFGIFSNFLTPIVEVSGILYFLTNIKKNFSCLLAISILVLMNSIISGGRFALAYLILELIIGYLLLKDRLLIKVKISKTFIFIVLIFFILCISGISLLRGIDNEDMLKHYYVYLCGNIVFFDINIPMTESLTWHPFTSAIWGFWAQFLPFIHAIGIPYPDWYLSLSNSVMNTQEQMLIGENIVFNAYSTPFYYLYADARWLGVIIGMYIFGLFARRMYELVETSKSHQSFCFYLIVCQMSFNTIFSYPFVNNGYLLIALYLLWSRKICKSPKPASQRILSSR